jgi:hypothetical protein
MNRMDAYAMLAVELESWRRIRYADLAALIGKQPIATTAMSGSELIDIEVSIHWTNEKQRAIRIHAIAYGPSCWTLERFEEAIVVRAPTATEDESDT